MLLIYSLPSSIIYLSHISTKLKTNLFQRSLTDSDGFWVGSGINGAGFGFLRVSTRKYSGTRICAGTRISFGYPNFFPAPVRFLSDSRVLPAVIIF